MQGEGEVNFSGAAGEVLSMQFSHPLEMGAQCIAHLFGQDGDAFAKAFTVAHGDAVVSEINILYPQAHAFHEAQSAAVEQLRHEPIIAFEPGEHRPDFCAGEYHRNFRRALNPLNVVDEVEFATEHLLIQKERCGKGLVLGGGGDLFVHGKMGEEGGDFVFAHFIGMALAVKKERRIQSTYACSVRML